jgi:hypothetical protein
MDEFYPIENIINALNNKKTESTPSILRTQVFCLNFINLMILIQ